MSQSEELPSPLGRDDSVTLEPGRFAVALKKSAVGHDKVQIDPRNPARSPRDAFHESVGHDLAAS